MWENHLAPVLPDVSHEIAKFKQVNGYWYDGDVAVEVWSRNLFVCLILLLKFFRFCRRLLQSLFLALMALTRLS